ncbi:MAG TPA: hypothetical protein VK581_13935 [Chthoniobacterales bacterium]|nr:hypothetical protein [Chthoniobacterales bacterium]
MKPKTMFHIPIVKYLLIILVSLSFASAISAFEEGTSYAAFLSEKDHYNTNGDRLTSVADILRQDRANYHKGRGDRQDEDDGGIFATTEGRAKFESYQIVLENIKAAALIEGSQRSVVVRVRGRRIHVEAVE